MNKNKIKLLWDWFLSKERVIAIGSHFKEFGYIWIVFCLLVIAASIATVSANGPGWTISRHIVGISIVLFVCLFMVKPMNAVFGLMGTSGSIRVFFFNFLFISFLFSIIYYFGFFRNAGVSYDVNQPHIAYDYYLNSDRVTKPVYSIDTLIYCTKDGTDCDTVYQKTKIVYQPIKYKQVLQNTIMTSLMQEPTDLFAEATTYNSGMESNDADTKSSLNKEKATAFYWILIFQILISWVFFGVFISLLYNKFRYES